MPETNDPAKPAAGPNTDPRSAPGPGPGPGIPGHPADPGPGAVSTQNQARPPAHPEAPEGSNPEKVKAVADARKAGDRPVTEPGTPGKRPPLVITTELAEARATLQDMHDGKDTGPEHEEVRATREGVERAEAELTRKRADHATAAAKHRKPVDPDALHAQHYAVRRLEDELHESHDTAAK